MKKLFSLMLLIIIAFLGSGYSVTRAQVNDTLKVDCSQAAGSTFCKEQEESYNKPVGNPLLAPDSIAGRITQIVIVLAGVVSIFVMILAGISFMTSGGKPDKIATARNSIIYASIGLVISISAQFIVSFVLSSV